MGDQVLQSAGSNEKRYRLYIGYDDVTLEKRNQSDGVDLPPMMEMDYPKYGLARDVKVSRSIQDLEIYWRIPAVDKVGLISEQCAKCLRWDPEVGRKRCVVYLESFLRTNPVNWLNDDDYLTLGRLLVFGQVQFRVADGGTPEETTMWKVMWHQREVELLEWVKRKIGIHRADGKIGMDEKGQFFQM